MVDKHYDNKLKTNENIWLFHCLNYSNLFWDGEMPGIERLAMNRCMAADAFSNNRQNTRKAPMTQAELDFPS